jgi:hypothetical protein
MTLLI